MSNTRLRERIVRLFAEKMHVEISAPDADLFESGALDSLSLVELLLQLEQEFGVKISLDELDLDHFRSIAKIAEFVADTVIPAPVVNELRPALARAGS
jgi:methoxymalonate biosynthesis acyl carrier protein